MRFKFLFGRKSFFNQISCERARGVAPDFGLAFVFGAIKLFVIGKRMRIRSYDVRVNERRPAPLAAILNCPLNHVVAGKRVAAVNFLNEETRKSAHKFRYAAARRLHFDRDRDRVAVVFDQVKHGQVQSARRVERFKELAFARRPVASRYVNDCIRLIARDKLCRVADQLCAIGGFGAADRLKELRARRRRLCRRCSAFCCPNDSASGDRLS